MTRKVSEPAINKNEKLHRVASATLSLIVQHGARSLNPTRVARAAKVSRPWVYKYVGGSQQRLMEFAVEHFGALYSRLNEVAPASDPKAWVEDELKGFENSFAQVNECPWILPAYYRYKGSVTPLGRSIDRIEEAYLNKKEKQLQSALKSRTSSARVWAEILMATKLALVHRWTLRNAGKMPDQNDIELLKKHVRHLLDQIHAM